MIWKTVSIVAAALILVVSCWWYADGAQIFTKTARQVAVRDDLFGTESVQWEQDFQLGLDIAAPSALVLAAIGAFSLFKARRTKQ